MAGKVKKLKSVAISGKDAIKAINKAAKGETIMIRLDKRRKSVIQKRAATAGLSVSAYLLAKEALAPHPK
ncbi:MAG: hypothetical protein V3S46_03655 [Nitrospinota bacterium]